MSNNKVVKGAVILIATNFIVKFIGLIYKIPLTNLIGAYGMSFFNAAYEIYLLLVAFSTAGLPVAISKMVSESRTLGNYRDINRIVKASLFTFGISGIVGTIVMLIGADFFAEMTSSSLAAPSIVALAPSVLFFSFVAILRGYFQGLQNMNPTALTQIVEATVKITFGMALALFAINIGRPVNEVAAFAILGTTISIAAAGILLGVIYLSKKNRSRLHRFSQAEGESSPYRKIIKDLIIIAIPVTLGSFVVNLTGFLDLFLINNRLTDIGLSEYEANTLYGAYRSLAYGVFGLPVSIMATINVTIIPAIASVYVSKNYEKLKELIKGSVKVVIIMSIPCFIGLFALPYEILITLYPAQPSDVLISTPILRVLSISTLAVSASSMLIAILQATGRTMLPIFAVFCGGVVKVFLNYVLVGIESIGIYGAPIGTFCCYTVIMVMNLYFIKKHLDVKVGFMKMLAKPMISSIIMGIVAIVLCNILETFIPTSVALIITILVSVLVYFVLLFATKAITKSDLDLMPGGSRIKRLLKLND